MNENVESFETIPWTIDQIIEEITGENSTPAVIKYNENNQKTDDEEDNLIHGEITTAFDHEIDLSFLEAPFAVTPEDAMAAEKLLNLSNGANRATATTAAVKTTVCVPNLNVNVDVAAVVNEAAAAVIESGQTDFDADEEQRKLLNLLQISTPTVATAAVLEPVAPQLDFRHVKCHNCLKVFQFEDFQFHICDHDENHQLITLPGPTEIVNEMNSVIKLEQILPEEPPAVRLLRENQVRIRRFLKEELKYEVPAPPAQPSNSFCTNSMDGSNTVDCSRRSVTHDYDLNFQASTSKQAAVATPSNSSNGKKQEISHECTICDRRFVHASGLLRHIEKHTLDLIPTSSGRQTAMPQNSQCLRVVVKCQLCGRVFFEPGFALIHLFKHFPSSSNDGIEMDNYMDMPYDAFVDDAIACIQQEQQISGFNACHGQHDTKASSYLKIIILGSVLQCEFCDYIFTDVSYLFLHSSVHSPQRRFECLSCEISVSTSKEIYSHFQAECVFVRESLKVAQANIQRYFVCNVCEKKFQTLEHLHEHRYTVFHFFPRLNPKLQKLQTPCEYCELTFDFVKSLVFHFEEQHFKKCKREKETGVVCSTTSHKLRQYLCDVCGKSYTQSSHLWQHLRFHQGEYVFWRCATSIGFFKLHSPSNQEGVKPFACQEPGCSRKFTIRPDLHDHIRKCHTGERPFHCHICGKRFLTGSVFYQHRLIHRGERRYECSQCGKRFYRADALKNHTRIHTGEKPYDCEYCTKSFRQRGDCEKHIRARHAHLDENTRNMLKIQKMNLKSAAANKLNEQSSISDVNLNLQN